MNSAVSIQNSGKTGIKKQSAKTKSGKLILPKRTIIKIALTFSVILILLGTGLTYTFAYDGKIYPKLNAAGVDIGGLTVAQAKAALETKVKELNENGPTITYNGQTVKPKLDEMGVSFDINKAINDAYQFGRANNLFSKIKDNIVILSKGAQINIAPEINEDKFNSYLNQLAQTAGKDPVNATLKYTNGNLVSISEQNGRGLDKNKLKEDLKGFINSGKNGQIVMVTSDLEPIIKAGDTSRARLEAEKMLGSAPIAVTYENSNWVASRDEIGSWLEFSEKDKKLSVTANPDSFINNIAGAVEITKVDKEIEDGTGRVLNEGQDGRAIDKNTLFAQIKGAVSNGTSGASFMLLTSSVSRGEKTIYPHAQPGRYEGRYIDINLSEQTLYAFEGNTQVNQFLISSGKSGYRTPIGEYSVWGKTRSQTMDGPDFYLPNVQWISWFNGEISIHGTYWHNNFGTPMSHGCINASNANAEWIYNWDDIGTPVYVHY